MESSPYSPSSVVFNKWSQFFKDSTNSVLSSSYSICSHFRILQDTVSQLDSVDDYNDDLSAFKRGVESLQSVVTCFENVFDFSVSEDSNEDNTIIGTDEYGLEEIVTTDNVVENSNKELLDDMRRNKELQIVTSSSSISSFIKTNQDITDRNLTFIRTDLQSGTRSSYLEKHVPPLEMDDETQAIMNQIYDSIYKKLGDGNCMIMYGMGHS